MSTTQMLSTFNGGNSTHMISMSLVSGWIRSDFLICELQFLQTFTYVGKQTLQLNYIDMDPQRIFKPFIRSFPLISKLRYFHEIGYFKYF